MRVVVTGAGGFVGAHLIECLSTAGHEAIATSVSPPKGLKASHILQLDVTDDPAVADFLGVNQPDAIVHLAAQASVPISWAKPQLTYQVNLVGTLNLLEACKGTDVRILIVGSGQQYRAPTPPRPIVEDDPMTPTNPYAASKIAAEEAGFLYHRHHAVQVVSARAFNHTGPGQTAEYAAGTFSRQIAAIVNDEAEKRLKVGNLDARRDLLDVRDVVQAYRLLLESGEAGMAYNVCSGEPVSMREVLEMLLVESGLSGVVQIDENPDARPGDIPVLFGDPSRIRSAVGWERRISLSESLRDTLAWTMRSTETEER